LAKLLADKKIGRYIVPIVPDEARTFGMESLFRKIGIYSHVGQNYEPVDRSSLLYYKEATDGQILEEGITEAGSMASFIAAGTAYSTFGHQHGALFFFYSMFGFQRIGDLIWAAGDIQARGFLLGATAGRTTLAGEGLQHQDGHSHILALPNPSLLAYDPAFAFEIAVIVREGLRRMLEDGENLVYYLTITNEFYPMPAMPAGSEEGILKGIYKFSLSLKKAKGPVAHLLGSGAILNECLKAQDILEDRLWRRCRRLECHQLQESLLGCQDTERWNRLNPEKKPRPSFLQQQTDGESGVFVAACDYLKALPETIARQLPGPVTVLGTDGYGRSETREALRDFFEVDARHIAFAALAALAREKTIPMAPVKKARKALNINPERSNPLFA
jgi:pyruvate dehydrogenase E1 component